MSHRKLTQDELADEAARIFGDPLDFAFQCPSCDDIAAIREFPEGARERAGQECIGRSLGALKVAAKDWDGRGCDWTAYGLIRGPWEVVMPDGRSVWCFPLAPAPVPADTAVGSSS